MPATPIALTVLALLAAAAPDDKGVKAGGEAAGGGPGEGVARLTAVEKGASATIGYYKPRPVELKAEKPATITKAPEGLEAPMYGVLPMWGGVEGAKEAAGGKKDARIIHVVLDEPEGKPARLFVDANGDGDLTNDPGAEWAGKKTAARGEPGGEPGKEYTMYSGGATVDLGTKGGPFPAHLSMYRFDKADPARAQVAGMLFYYRDYATEGEVTVGGTARKVMLVDDAAAGDFRGKAIDPGAEEKDGGAGAGSGVVMLIDANGNGKFDRRGEQFDVRKPFNIGGTTYEVRDLAADGRSLRVVRSDQEVAEVPTPPDLTVGKKVIGFEARTTDGKDVKFPETYKGKVVMLDFWATWCGPCMREVPGLVKVYEQFHPQGFEVLGISLDQKDSAEKVAKVTGEKGMAWPQVYDGRFWKAEVAQKYGIDSIPATFLVDGDSGEVLATGNELRGEKLAATVGAALGKKKGTN